MRKLLRYILSFSVIAAALIWLNNAALLASRPQHAPRLLAHRGMAQTFPHAGIDAETCTAARIYPPEHRFIENTLASMQAAFDAGADIIELDIHPTADGQFAVFHDWTLDCRTNGTGVTREHTLADLKALDIGYGYTADGGKTFPLRGKGIGLLPSLDEVLSTFPTKRFLIHVKSNDAHEGELLAARLSRLSAVARARLMVYGGTPPVEALRAMLPDIKTGSKAALKGCLIGYITQGWLGIVPSQCRAGLMLVPVNVAPWLWGWPARLQQRMDDAGVELVVLGTYDGGQFSTGIDSPGELSDLPADFSGVLWTNRIDVIGPMVRKKER